MTPEEHEELIQTIAMAMVGVRTIVDVPLAVHIADTLIEAGYVKRPF